MILRYAVKPFLMAFLILGFTQCRSTEDPTKNTPENAAAESEAEITSTFQLQRHTYQQSLMGTRFSITLYVDGGSQGKSQADLAAKAAFQFAIDVNAACSDYDITSELMRVNHAPAHQAIPISPLLYDILDSALTIAKKTHGAYDPTLGHHSYNWRMARKKGILPSVNQLSIAQAASGWKHLHLDARDRSVTKQTDRMRLDLGGIAKGYAAEKMLQILKQHQITSASVTAGGEIRLGDPPPHQEGWKITLKTLDANHQLSPHTLMLSNCAVSTSGDLHQSITIDGQRYSHIVNPATGLGLTHRISATIIADNATLTDALATAYCVQPDLHYPNIQSMVIREKKDGALQKITSPHWNEKRGDEK